MRIAKVEPKVVTFGAHAGNTNELNVSEAENRLLVPWAERLKGLEII